MRVTHLDDGLDIIPSQIMMGSEAVARSEALEPALPELKGPDGGGQKRAREEETPLEDFEASSMFAGARLTRDLHTPSVTRPGHESGFLRTSSGRERAQTTAPKAAADA